MDYSRKISERLWNLPDKGELESRREETFMDDIIQKSHLEKELLSHLEGIIRLAGPGAYARTLPRELLVKIMKDPTQRSEFLEFCHFYDSNPYVCGMGKDNLFAMGELARV